MVIRGVKQTNCESYVQMAVSKRSVNLRLITCSQPMLTHHLDASRYSVEPFQRKLRKERMEAPLFDGQMRLYFLSKNWKK